MTTNKNSIVARQTFKYIHALRHSETLDHGTAQHAAATTKASKELAFLRVLLSETDAEMPPNVRDTIMRALGAADDKPRSGGHRNCYAPRKDDGRIAFAIERGWMKWGTPYRDTRFAHVTEAGAKAAGHAAFFAYRRHLRSQKMK